MKNLSTGALTILFFIGAILLFVIFKMSDKAQQIVFNQAAAPAPPPISNTVSLYVPLDNTNTTVSSSGSTSQAQGGAGGSGGGSSGGGGLLGTIGGLFGL